MNRRQSVFTIATVCAFCFVAVVVVRRFRPNSPILPANLGEAEVPKQNESTLRQNPTGIARSQAQSENQAVGFVQYGSVDPTVVSPGFEAASSRLLLLQQQFRAAITNGKNFDRNAAQLPDSQRELIVEIVKLNREIGVAVSNDHEKPSNSVENIQVSYRPDENGRLTVVIRSGNSIIQF